MGIPAVFEKACELGIAMGASSIKDLEGCWECQVDDVWFVAINGHADKKRCSGGNGSGDSEGPEVPPYSVYVGFNGWPAAIVDASGGSFVAGALASEDAFIRVIDERLAKYEETA